MITQLGEHESTVKYNVIDHIAIAVVDLEQSILFYRDVLGLELVERRQTEGKTTGMLSAVFSAGNFTIVLLQGTSEESQVSRYVQEYGPGVQHVALAVDNLEEAADKLRSQGFDFATNLINGNGLKQIFSKRDKNSGMMYELIERTGEEGFLDDNVQSLFNQLEAEKAY